MSALPIQKVHGDHLVRKIQPAEINLNDFKYDLTQLIKGTQVSGSRLDVNYLYILNTPAYSIKTSTERSFYNAHNGTKLQPLAQDDIARQANHLYAGQGSLSQLTLLPQYPREIGGKAQAVWQVSYSDWVDTQLYIHPISGELIKVRSNLWYLFDFFWMLHIMDYDEREDFNHPLLIAFAFASVLFSLSGILLLYQAIRQRWLKKRRQYAR